MENNLENHHMGYFHGSVQSVKEVEGMPTVCIRHKK
jgi:hypothetical protein